MYYYDPMNGNGWGWDIFMMFFWLLFLMVIAVVVIRLFRGHDHHGYHNHQTGPIDIAKERYAKGEITKEQFEQLKKDLAK
jgi:putative membrane protein